MIYICCASRTNIISVNIGLRPARRWQLSPDGNRLVKTIWKRKDGGQNDLKLRPPSGGENGGTRQIGNRYDGEGKRETLSLFTTLLFGEKVSEGEGERGRMAAQQMHRPKHNSCNIGLPLPPFLQRLASGLWAGVSEHSCSKTFSSQGEQNILIFSNQGTVKKIVPKSWQLWEEEKNYQKP